MFAGRPVTPRRVSATTSHGPSPAAGAQELMSHPHCDASCVPSAPLPLPAEAHVSVQPHLEPAELPPPLRRTRDQRRIDAWGLVLMSKGLQGLVTFADGVFALYVPTHQALRARIELDAADAEEREQLRTTRHAAGRSSQPATRHALMGGVLVALLLVAFFAVTGPRAGGSAWFSAGAADAERVLQGEWWRAVTALTLHADGAHVASNIGIGALVVGAVMRSEGVGFGAALVLASGSAGNLLNAWAHQSLHSSVGFSTAVFAAIGLLGG